MASIVYGIAIEDAEGYNADDIRKMSVDERFKKFVRTFPRSLEVFRLEEFFYKLNNDEIDTENNYYFIV